MCRLCDGTRRDQMVLNIDLAPTDGKDWIVLVDQSKNVRPATDVGEIFRFPAQEISLVRLTFTHCSAGDIAHVVEIAGGCLDQTVTQRLVQRENMTAGLHGAWGSIDTRYDRHVPPEDCNSRQWHVTAWRGERVNVRALA